MNKIFEIIEAKKIFNIDLKKFDILIHPKSYIHAIVKFKNLFPVSLTSLSFDATETDINYFTASASFRYTVYNITDTSGNLL